jgi:hypothetical protein
MFLLCDPLTCPVATGLVRIEFRGSKWTRDFSTTCGEQAGKLRFGSYGSLQQKSRLSD